MKENQSEQDFVLYETDGPIHASSFMNSLIVPRPIAFITSVGEEGVVNAAPFSYFNVACTNPVMVSVAIERREHQFKDTSRNIENTKEFVINLCSIENVRAVSIAGGDYPPEVSEIELAELDLLPSHVVKVPRIASTFAQLECRLFKRIEIGKDPTDLILANVEKVHVHKSLIKEDGKIDINAFQPLARLAGPFYAELGKTFIMPRGLAAKEVDLAAL